MDECVAWDVGFQNQKIPGRPSQKTEIKMVLPWWQAGERCGFLWHLCTCHKMDCCEVAANPNGLVRISYETSRRRLATQLPSVKWSLQLEACSRWSTVEPMPNLKTFDSEFQKIALFCLWSWWMLRIPTGNTVSNHPEHSHSEDSAIACIAPHQGALCHKNLHLCVLQFFIQQCQQVLPTVMLLSSLLILVNLQIWQDRHCPWWLEVGIAVSCRWMRSARSRTRMLHAADVGHLLASLPSDCALIHSHIPSPFLND